MPEKFVGRRCRRAEHCRSTQERHAPRGWQRTLGLFALLGSLALSAPAFADGTADEADLHFDLGLADFAKGDHNSALVHFFHSNRLVPNRNVLYNIAKTYEAMKRYADAHRYYVDSREGETDAKKKADADSAIARLAPNVALLDVATSPPGATIYIDRKDLGSAGKAPRPLALAPGKYKVIAELEGYEPRTSEVVEVIQGKEAKITLELTKVVGKVHIDVSGGKSAAVRVDDEKAAVACDAPCDIALPPGRHELYFQATGFDASPRTVVVAAGQTANATAVLVPVTGSIVARTDERDALVIVDGKSMGFTPVVLQGVPVGRRRVQIRLRGYTDYTANVEVRANQQADLGEIAMQPAREVSAVSRQTETIDDAPSSVTVLDRRELAAFGYPTIAEALRGVRGVTLSNDHAYASASIRGIGQPNDYGNRLLVLSDGQSLNDNLLYSSYIGSDGRVDLHDVDRIEVVRGPGSLLYGTGAFSGLVNLVTRSRDEPDGVHVGIGGYDNSVLHARAGAHYHFSKDAGIWASASVANSDGYDLPVPGLAANGVTPVARGTDSFLSGGTAGRVYYKSLTLQWFYHQREQRIPVGAFATVFDDVGSTFLDRRYMAEARFEPRIEEQWQVLARAHANRYEFKSRYLIADDTDVMKPSGEVNREELIGTWLGGEARVVYTPRPWLRITAGGEAQYHPDVTLRGTAYIKGKPDDEYLTERRPYSSGAGYALIDATPLPWLRLSLGGRVDSYSTFPDPLFVPRAAVIFKPDPRNVIKIMAGRAFRAPSIYEQYYNDGGESALPAVDLGPESIYSGEVEYTHRFFEDWVALVAVHASFVQNIVITQPDTLRPELVRYANSEHPALVGGGDLELRREWRRGYMLSASYSYQNARFLDPAQANDRLVNAPEHLASLRAVAPAIKDVLSFGMRLSLEAPRRIRQDSDATTGTTVVADVTASGYVRDIGVRYVVGVYNLADKRYEVPVSDTFATRTLPQNGRTFLVNAVWTWP